MNEEQLEAFKDWVLATEWSVHIDDKEGVRHRHCPTCHHSERIGHAWYCKLKILINVLMRQ